jgi:lipid-A-disaccharide synthase
MKSSCLIITGEKSGEEHALSFFNNLKKESPETSFFGVGGDELKKEGLELLFHINEFSSWGYSEVITKIPFYIKAMNKIVEEVKRRECKTAILIDYQSFNLKLAGKLKELGVDVLYYVAPQAWAWKEYRVKKLSRSVHTLFTIIPFEKKWFLDRGVKNVISIDHPLWTTYKNELQSFHKAEKMSEPLKIVLLPGSRKFEVQSLLPIFIETLKVIRKDFPIKVSIVQSSSVPQELYDSYGDQFDQVYTNEELVTALKEADFSLAASGTVTLTCALFEVPTIVCYKTSLLNQFIFETVVNYNWFISLANIVQNRAVFPELLQDKVSVYNIVSYLRFWYYNKTDHSELLKKLKQTKDLVRGDALEIPKYMAEVIKKSYDKKADTIF